jgi:hypothetical protein
MNATAKDLARIAAAVARQTSARAPRAEVNGAQRNAGHSVRARLHAATTVALAIVVGVLVFKLSEERGLRRQVEAQRRDVSTARIPNIGAERQRAAWGFQAALIARMGMAGNTTTNAAALTTPAATPSATRDRDVQQQLRHPLSGPALRSALRGQQRSAVLQLYGDLLRSWHLPADKSDRVLDVLAEQQLQEIEQSLNAGEPGNAGTTTASSDAAMSAKDELGAVLTEQQRKELQRQQETLSERLTIGSLADELSLAQIPLTDGQRDQLTQVMVDERKAVPIPDVSGFPANSPDAQRALEDWQSALDQRMQDRAATILTSAQQTRYEQFMQRQRDARKVFAAFEVAPAGDNSGAAAAPAPSSP